MAAKKAAQMVEYFILQRQLDVQGTGEEESS